MNKLRAGNGQPRRCVVWLASTSGFLGTGFFVAPGTVLTCAHVAAANSDLRVVWPGGSGVQWTVETKQLFPPDYGPGDFYEFPDIAIVTVADAEEHPWLPLGEDEPATGSRVEAIGFSTATPAPSVQADSLLVTVAGESGGYLRVVGDQVVPGFSGSPALDPATGLVCGMVKATRDHGGALGGWLIPVGALRDVLAEFGLPAVRSVPHSPILPAPLRDLLRAQRLAGARTPYPLRVRDAPSLANLYVRQRVQFPADPEEEPSRRAEPASHTVDEALRANRHCVIVGEPGIGKSTLLRHLAAESATWWLTAHDSGTTEPNEALYGLVVPCHLPARKLVGTSVREAIAAAGGPPDSRPVPNLPDAEWLVLVDGLDEIVVGDERRQLIDALADDLTNPAFPYRLVITSRPLLVRELAALRVGDTAEYELCRFSPEDLAEFSRRWFAAGDRSGEPDSADHFLDRIEHARLGAIVAVPLLATIAATVFQADDGVQLPPSRFGLYDTFVGYLLQARQPEIRTREALRHRLGAYSARGDALADWLFDERRALLEHLARHDLRGDDRSLLGAAADYLNANTPVPVDAVPDWPDLLTSLLLSTGVLVQQGDDVRFLHHSFAEFLAAKAEAFVAADRWIEYALDPTRHHTAMFVLDRWSRQPGCSADAMAAELAGGSRIRAVLAGEILAAGVPVGATTEERIVEGLLRHLRNPRFPDGDVMSVLKALPGRQTVAAGLSSLMTDRRVHKLCRIRAAELHASRVLGAVADRPAGLDTLHAIAEDCTTDAYSRTRAIETLTRLGEGGQWAESLHQIGASASTPGFIRIRAAEALISARDVASGVRILREIAIGADGVPSIRVSAARALADAGEPSAATTVLRELADAGDGELDGRIEAARALVDLGDGHGVDMLRELVTSVHPWDRPQVARELIEAGERDYGVKVLLDIVGEHLGELPIRIRAAGALADTGHRRASLPTLRLAARSRPAVALRLAQRSMKAAVDVVVNKQSTLAVGVRDRALCAWRLVLLGEPRPGRRTLSRLSVRKSVPDPDRIWIAQLLLDVGESTAALRTLRQVATAASGATTNDRTAAAKTLADYGEYETGIDVLHAVATDPSTAAADQFSAATALLDLGDTDRGLEALQRLTRAKDGVVRLHAARVLMDRGQVRLGVAVLTALAHDPAQDNYVRISSATQLADSGQTADARQALLHLVRTPGDDIGSVTAVRALIDRGFHEDGAQLLRRLISWQLSLPDQREQAVHLLARVSGPDVVHQFLHDMASNAIPVPSDHRAWATELLVIAAGSVEAGTALLRELVRDDLIADDDLWRTVRILSDCHGPDALISYLRDVSTDETIGMFRRIGAAHQRAQLGDTSGLDVLVDAAVRAGPLAENRAILLYLLEVLDKLPGSDQVTTALAEIASSKRYHPDECALATKILAGKDRGRALRLLTAIIEDPAWSLIKRANSAELLAELGERTTAIQTLRTVLDQADPKDYWRPEAETVLRRLKHRARTLGSG